MRKVIDILKSSIVKNSLWLFVLQIANMVLPLLTIPYVTRVLGVSGYGEYSIAYNWMTYFRVFVEYGFALGGARKIAISESPDEDNKCFTEIIASRLLLFIISFFMISLICAGARVDSIQFSNTLILMLVVLSVVFQANWIFQGKQQMKFITIVNVIGRLISVFLILAFVKNSSQVWLYCFLYSITFIFSSIIGLTIAINRFKLKLVKIKCNDIIAALKENFPLFASAAISSLFGNIGITILGIYAVEEVVGGYSAVYKIPYIMTLMFSPISQALYPYISREYSKSVIEAKKILGRITFFVLGTYGVGGLVIIATRNIIVTKFLGDEYIAYSDLVLFLIPQMLFGITNNFLGVQTLVASGRQARYTKCVLWGALILVALNLLLCPIMEASGTAISALISEAFLTLFLLITCTKYVWKD